MNDKTEIKHITELLDFIAAFTNDHRYENVKGDLEKLKAKGEKVVMCEYLDMMMAEGEQRGIQTGIQTGRKEGERMMAKLMECLLVNGLTEEIHEALTDEDARAEMYIRYGIAEAIDNDDNIDVVVA